MATPTTITPTARVPALGLSLWLDNITRGLLTSGTLHRCIDVWSVTGLTSNSTIFDHAIENAPFYDDAIRQKSGAGVSGEQLVFELAVEDLHQAAAVSWTLPVDGGDAEAVLGQFTKGGLDVAALGDQLQREGAQSFDDSWHKLIQSLASKSSPNTTAGPSAKGQS